MLTAEDLKLLQQIVLAGESFLISGAAGSGKTRNAVKGATGFKTLFFKVECKQFGKVPEEESIPSEEAMENPEVFEGFENEEEKRSSKYRRRYSAEEQNGGKTRGQ
jgi:hypothetical protein